MQSPWSAGRSASFSHSVSFTFEVKLASVHTGAMQITAWQPVAMVVAPTCGSARRPFTAQHSRRSPDQRHSHHLVQHWALSCRATGGSSGEIPTSVARLGDDEEVFYEGRGAPAELVVSLLLGATLLYLPLTAQSIRRRLWISYKFTNKRLVVSNTSPLFAKETQILWSNVREVRAAPRAFSLWGDIVIFLKDGSRLELLGVENHQKLKGFVDGYIV